MVLLPAIMKFRVDFLSFWPAALLALVPAAFVPYAAWRKMSTLRSMLEVTTVALLLVVPVLVLTYASMRFNMPMADAQLIAMDRSIGLDWRAFVLFVDRSEEAARILKLAYESLMTQMILLPVLLCLFRHQARAYQFMLSLMTLSLLSAIISIPFPSAGAYVGYGLDGASLRHINTHFGYFFLESFNAVREQDNFVLSLRNAAGIITFPSGHAAFAVLCIWAGWPSVWLRLPVLSLNVLMLVSAITHGAHYFVDVFAGGALAIVGIALATRRAGNSLFSRRTPQWALAS